MLPPSSGWLRLRAVPISRAALAVVVIAVVVVVVVVVVTAIVVGSVEWLPVLMLLGWWLGSFSCTPRLTVSVEVIVQVVLVVVVVVATVGSGTYPEWWRARRGREVSWEASVVVVVGR